jgi:hypothetical protein
MIRFILTCAIAIGFIAYQPASAQEPSTEDVVKALVPTKKLRAPRGLTIQGEDKPPSIDLYIPFEYDSDKLTTEAMLTLNRRGAQGSSAWWLPFQDRGPHGCQRVC